MVSSLIGPIEPVSSSRKDTNVVFGSVIGTSGRIVTGPFALADLLDQGEVVDQHLFDVGRNLAGARDHLVGVYLERRRQAGQCRLGQAREARDVVLHLAQVGEVDARFFGEQALGQTLLVALSPEVLAERLGHGGSVRVESRLNIRHVELIVNTTTTLDATALDARGTRGEPESALGAGPAGRQRRGRTDLLAPAPQLATHIEGRN